MSIDAGGVAQMTYQSPFNNSIGVSGPGYASRGKGSHIKRLSVAPPPKISTIDETQQANVNSTPRTSRGHLLAGLRTAPKSATVPPATNGLGPEGSRYGPSYHGAQIPQTATGMHFAGNRNSFRNSFHQSYSLPEHVLAPPALDFVDGADTMDQTLYDELVATNNYLAQQQRALQQQLFNVTAAAQQLGGLNLNAGMVHNTGQQFQSPVGSPLSLYNQQFQQGLQPVVQPVPGSPGVFAVYNPMTGQSNIVVDSSVQQRQVVSPHGRTHSVSPPPTTTTPGYQQQFNETSYPLTETRSKTPPKSTPSPQQSVEPLPPPSANAFRRGHRKNISSVNVKTAGEWTRASGVRSAGFPQTPATGTFGPGQARAGEHPVRQPKGPPLLQELQEKPTAKHEGSKNFATRQRRQAVHDLVRAGRERRSDGRQSGSGAGTPGSENEFNFSVSSDNDSMLAGSTSLSSRPSLGSLRAAANGAIGSEIKEKSRERSSVDSVGAISAKSLSSDEGNSLGGAFVEVEPARRNTPRLVLSSAEKRKSFIM
ncbi:hypothetical protein A1O3_10250 [Capronia epimyces CBS 606.96]|uniref:Uncharacterized protein n=1 Tax=Capronia epimyces CBS 606.96 TaxID=1182542 RepID=W9X9E6_9EURO|nr:uncharacterized protein A1O3_10250 [Capronia epimyces CBS 606.96]EXJ77092.1 hypothetical protein A1O3_10250 [Capronia epimyces CBS 606.96]